MKITKILMSVALIGGLPTLAAAESKNFFDIFNDWYQQEPRERETLKDAFLDGDFFADFRLRYEDVTQNFSSFDKGAQALTLRSKFRYESMQYELFSLGFGFIDNRAIPDDDTYNSGINGETDDAIVSDPESTELNEAWLSYDIINTLFKYGRQSVSWDNGRFIGNESWRQLDQSYSGLTVKNEFLNYIRVQLAQLNRLESVLGEDADDANQNIDAKLFNLQYRGFINSVVSLYSYDLDNESGSNVWDTATHGLRFAGKIENEPMIEYAFEYAKQTDKHDNPSDYSASYLLYELGVTYSGVRAFVGQETLGADESAYFIVPLGSKHKFQGYADQFENGGLGNIAGGIKDSYYSLGYIFSKQVSLVATMHDFESDDSDIGPGDLGSELDVEAKYEWGEYKVSLKYSDYDADDFGNDIEKIWVSTAVSF